jgi:ATP-binding cassette subfamily F protein 3
MVSAVNIALQYGGKVLLREVGFRIGARDRIALVGSNGTGKSTLLRILLGEVLPDSGEVSRAKYVTVGYLPQEGVAASGRTLYEEAQSVFGDILETERRITEVQHQLSVTDPDSDEHRELVDVYGELQHKLETSDAFRMKATIEKVLTGLGFAAGDLRRRTEEFSGGWQMRIVLAKLLLEQPSLLLLDEPTNHLDLDSLQWLEEYIASYEGAVVIVSHDRRFLDNMTRRTFELSLGNLTEYAGNFSAYLLEREGRREQALAAWKNQQQQIKQTERFIERFRYKATKARQVQSRIKQLEKMERIEIEDEERGIRFHFPPAPMSGRTVMELRGIQKRYGSLSVFEGLDFDLGRGDRVAFVGVNGAGKSTLARIIAGVEPVTGGVRTVGHNVQISYFAQHQAEELSPSNDVLQTVDEVATGEIRKHLRTLLGSFLFSGDDVFKRVAVLSGGEKSRLALAKMLLLPANLLVMDEPTNHLDVRSKAVLQDALEDFEGSCVIVSHDRDFLDPLVNKVLEFRRGRVKTFPGNVSDYIDAKKREGHSELLLKPSSRAQAPGERERKRREAEERQRRYERVRPVQDRVAQLERRIDEYERRKQECEELMGDPDFYKNGDRVRETTAEYKELEAALTDAYYRWNDLTAELERLSHEGGREEGRS